MFAALYCKQADVVYMMLDEKHYNSAEKNAVFFWMMTRDQTRWFPFNDENEYRS